MKPLSEIKLEQDEKFDKYFITDDGDYSYVGNDENSSTVKDFMHSRDLAIEEAVRAELVEYCADERDKLGNFNTLNDEYKEGLYMALNTIMKKYEV